MSKTIIIDPGHGGFDPGAVFGTRREKDDNLRLALAVGKKLSDDGYTVIYTRTDDRYDSPYDKAQIANSAGGDLFLSFHRNFAERPDLYQGVQALVYDKNPLAVNAATDINRQLEAIGFQNLGSEERKELVVLRRTNMPAVLLEVGFVNSSVDNRIFDEKFDEMVSAIADGVKDALPIAQAYVNLHSETEAAGRTIPSEAQASARLSETEGLRETQSSQMQGYDEHSSQTQTQTDSPQMQTDFSRQMPMDSSPQMQTDSSLQTSSPAKTGRFGEENSGNALRQAEEDMRSSLRNIPSEIVPNRPVSPEPRMWYYVQVGLFRYPENAVYLMEQLNQQGYDSIWKRIGGLIAIWVGPLEILDDAVAMQRRLQGDGYETLIVTDDYIVK